MSSSAANTVIEVTGLGKQYRLGALPAEHLRDRIVEGMQAAMRAVSRRTDTAEAPTVWALRDVSFTVSRGEVVGIVGGNGAGKSTLLKVLSRITTPTEGRAEIRGRVGSLLEVGTGFHPDLTGRENVLLNGAILGMTRAEILRKFDAIVEFAEVARFIDTPVKYYSSGMYVRLAFAVAAHLEPEILIVDEVLAVGDARFQAKCLGKLDEVARGGRTVLFVSHNMAAVQRLCTRALLLDHGHIVCAGEPRTVVSRYLSGEGRIRYVAALVGDAPQVVEAEVVDAQGHPSPRPRITEPIVVRLQVHLPADSAGTRLGIGVLGADGVQVFTTNLDDVGLQLPAGPGLVRADVTIPADTLLTGDYHVATCVWNDLDILDLQEPALSFSTDPGDSVLYQRSTDRKGLVHIACRWTLEACR
jgi:lipopolysaccharide transport system ATP-binding protein